MSSYTPPTSSGIDFDFTADGYSPPSASGLEFSFDLRPTYSSYADLSAFITGLSVSGSTDLGAFARPVFPSSLDLGSFLQTIPPVDLPAFVRPTHPSYKNLGAAIRRIDKENPADLGGFIQSFTTRDLTAFIGAHPPENLGAAIKAWYRENIKNLGAEAIGEFFKGSADIAAWIGMHPPANLGALLHGFAIIDLQGIIASIYKADLLALIQSTTLKNLNAVVQCIAPFNLPALLHGWDERFLGAELAGVYGPYDLQAYLRVHPYINLAARAMGVYSGYFNLRAIVEGTYLFDLPAFLAPVLPVDLGAFVLVRGQAGGLPASIIPNVIRIKQAIQVALLEHRDLSAIVNFQCCSSGFADLSVVFGTVYKKIDLTGLVWGWRPADNDVDLRCYINTATYSTEDVLRVKFVPDTRLFTQLKVRFGVTDKYTVFDTLPIVYGNYRAYMLNAVITGVLPSVNLSAYIRPIHQLNYTELPTSVKPKTHVIVYKMNAQMKEEWRKFVELMFQKDGAEPFHYFYVEGTGKVYKIERDRQWTIWATSYDTDEETMFDRFNVRKKFIYRMSKYRSVDEAVRDLIDRVSAYREAFLPASITGVDDRRKLDLSATIYPYGYSRRTWAKYLPATITAQFPPYIPPSGDAADLTISGSYTPPAYDDADLVIAYEGYPGT